MLGEYESLSLYRVGTRVSRYKFDFYCKDGEHWIPKNDAWFKHGVPWCPVHKNMVRRGPRSKHRGDEGRI